MKYELKATITKGTVVAYWTPGMDRLSFTSPYGNVQLVKEEMIASGELSRYVEHDDRVEETEDALIVHTIYNTQSAADRMYQMCTWTPNVLDVEIIPRPDLPDPIL